MFCWSASITNFTANCKSRFLSWFFISFTNVFTTISTEQACFPQPMAGQASEVNLCDITFCITFWIKSTNDCWSLASSLSGSHLTKKIRLLGNAPAGVEWSIAFGWFLSSMLYAVFTSLPAVLIMASLRYFDDELITITSTYQMQKDVWYRSWQNNFSMYTACVVISLIWTSIIPLLTGTEIAFDGEVVAAKCFGCSTLICFWDSL